MILCSKLRCIFLHQSRKPKKITRVDKCSSKRCDASAVRGRCCAPSSHSPANTNPLLHRSLPPGRNWPGVVQGCFQRHTLTKVCINWWNVSLLCNGCLNNGAFANAFCHCILRSMPRHYHKHSLKPTDDNLLLLPLPDIGLQPNSFYGFPLHLLAIHLFPRKEILCKTKEQGWSGLDSFSCIKEA